MMSIFALLFSSILALTVSAQVNIPSLPSFSGGQCSSCQLSFCPSAVKVPTGFGTTCETYEQSYSGDSSNEQCLQPLQDWWCAAISVSCQQIAVDIETKCKTALNCIYSKQSALSQEYIKQIVDSACSQSTSSTTGAGGFEDEQLDHHLL